MENFELSFKHIFDSDPNLVIILDKKYVVQEFNKTANIYFKDILNQELKSGQLFFDYFAKEQVDSIKVSVDKAYKGELIEYEQEIIGLDGISYWVEVCYCPILSDKEEIIGVRIAATPIKKRKIEEEVLTHRLAFELLVSKISSRFISFSDINQAMNMSLEDMGRFSNASRSYIFLFSDNGNMLDNTYEWCAEGISSEIENLQQIPSTSFPWWIEKLHKGEIVLVKGKETIENQEIVSLLILPIFVQRKLFGFVGFDNIHATGGWRREDLSLLHLTSEIFSNAFERLQVEEALKASERKFRELFRNANDIICVHTLEESGQKMRFIEVNDLACKKTGFSREEFFTMTAEDLCTPEFVPHLYILQDTIRQLGHITYEMDYVAKDGTKVPVEMNSHLFMLSGQQVVMSIGRDMTERLSMENELKQNNAALQDTIIKLKETQSRLIQQEQLAGIGQLAAGVAHEMNNPLAFVISNCSTLQHYLKILTENFWKYTEFFKKASLPAELNERFIKFNRQNASNNIVVEINEIIVDMQEGLERVENIVKGLCAFSRMDNDEEVIEFDLHEGIKNTLIVAINEYKYYAHVEQCFTAIPLIKGNIGQINQVLLNILLNATYAIKAKKISQTGLITISTYQTENHVCCEIMDNGIGISQADIGKIYNPFFTTKPVGEGTGLGLSIVYDIMVNKHHGDVEVESGLGQGTKFILKFPL
ncbi:MAG: hypothetical protein APF84_16825 [Gracilibacter sp. BRH_c7a]|nr:MAG: hypothetical protein APF84_16825 [Gracilibacter sp. BRH_c7a]